MLQLLTAACAHAAERLADLSHAMIMRGGLWSYQLLKLIIDDPSTGVGGAMIRSSVCVRFVRRAAVCAHVTYSVTVTLVFQKRYLVDHLVRLQIGLGAVRCCHLGLGAVRTTCYYTSCHAPPAALLSPAGSVRI